MFITNNIIESFHGKINKYIPKGKTTSKGFVLSMNNILKDSNLLKKDIKRDDFKTRTLLEISYKYNNKEAFKWFTYQDYKKIETKIIKRIQVNSDDNFIEDTLKEINDLEDNKNEGVNKLEENGSLSHENDKENNFEDNIFEIYENNDNDDKSLRENIMNEVLLSNFENIINELDEDVQKNNTDDNNIIIRNLIILK